MQFTKLITNPGKYPAYVSVVILLLRVTSGILMLTHGYGKLQRLLDGGTIKFADPFGAGPTVSLVLAVFAEVICSSLIILGVFTRLSAIPLIITMLTAAFIIHGGDPIRDKELAILYAVVFITIAFLGAGKYSVDNWLNRK